MKLSDGLEKQIYAIQEMDLPAKTEKRLRALGMVAGTKLAVLTKKKSALIITVRGTRLALGKFIASNIEIIEIKEIKKFNPD